ncbi:unnamed protein product [Bursaphelenchus xylophilus]|uniref:(pine wood nematode) hypothetical protein n=1 Tax=Bursaphelenchus xylophilus TaxID=6326 RepID=A0A1I7S0J9_BURXY|nr:unnamed protein product [Bursaphelenchus xylophilus]CAG9132296.1 unnamed protein product [Bursaphelenchus xylophilus]
MKFLVLILSLAVAAHAYERLMSFGNKKYGRMKMIQMLEAIAPEHERKWCANSTLNDVEDKYLTQPFDHFNKDDGRTWENHYQVQERYFNKSDPNQPEHIFLMIGGEGTSSPLFVCLDDVAIMNLAREHKALVIGSEHRFFGPNTGINSSSTANLKYLTTEQALEDLAKLIDHVNAEYKFKNPKWVAFGGSYPGTMAALFRITHPHKTLGNVASSAPLFPKVDFYEYAQVMEKAYNETAEGCLDNIAKAFKELEVSGHSVEGRRNLQTAFEINATLFDPVKATKNDIYTINLAIFDAFQGIVQYTFDGMRPERETGGNHTVTFVCEIMADKKLSNLKKLFKVFNLAHELEQKPQKMYSSYSEFIDPFKDESLEADGADMRGWMWLSCYQWGWLQSTTGSKTFGDTVPINYYYEQCKDLFGEEISANLVDARIRDNLKTYGYPENFNATNVVLPNGDFDPWNVLSSFVNRTETHTISVVTHAAAHCHDMYPPYEGEPEGLNATRAVIAEEVKYYLTLGKSALSVVSSTMTILLAYLVTRLV